MISQLSKLYSPAQPALLKPETCFQTLLLISVLEIVLKSAPDFLQFYPFHSKPLRIRIVS